MDIKEGKKKLEMAIMFSNYRRTVIELGKDRSLAGGNICFVVDLVWWLPTAKVAG